MRGAHLIFADGKTSSPINRGVLIVPDKAMPTFNVEVNVDGIGASKVSYGGYKLATRVAG